METDPRQWSYSEDTSQMTSATVRDLTGDEYLNWSLSSPPPSLAVPAEAPRAVSQSPARKPLPRTLEPPSHALSNVKSSPALATRPTGSVRNMATKFDRVGAANGPPPPQLKVETSNGRARRGMRSPTKSPVKDNAHTRLQKRRPTKPKSPSKSPTKTSFETSNTSFSSSTTANSLDSAQRMAAAKNAPFVSARPLFGEIRDGMWNGNFELGECAPLPTFNNAPRRSSDGNIALGHGRSASHQDILQPAHPDARQPAYYPPPLNHRRSRSAIDAYQPSSVPDLNELPNGYPTPPASASRQAARVESSSRIPVSNRRQSADSPSTSLPQSRSASAMSNTPSRNKPLQPAAEITPRKVRASSNEHGRPTAIPTRSRYDRSPVSTQNGQTLNAKIVAPPTSPNPPLRSSRPRQPVSAATTSASRARAADRFPNQSTRDARRPSEQWLGKPYDAQQERSRRNIPELSNINFAERKERVMRALSQNLGQSNDEPAPRTASRKLSSSRLSQSSRQSSLTRDAQATAGAQQPLQTPPVQHMAEAMPGGWPTPGGGRSRGLSLDTSQAAVQKDRETEPDTAGTARTTETAGTEFEVEESPVLGRPITQQQTQNPTSNPPMLLSSATYQPSLSRAVPPAISPVKEAPAEEVVSPSVLDNVLQMRQQNSTHGSTPATEFGDDSAPPSADESPSDLGERWGIDRQESIRIMLDQQLHKWDHTPTTRVDDITRSMQLNQVAHDLNGISESPVEEHFSDHQQTPRNDVARDDTIKPSLQPSTFEAEMKENARKKRSMSQGLAEYMSTGHMEPEMLDRIRDHLEGHFVDISRASANGESDGYMIGKLLDGLGQGLGSQLEDGKDKQESSLQVPQFEIPPVTPDTPPGWDHEDTPGNAVIFRNEPEEELDFQEQIRRADETYERAQRGDEVTSGAEPHEQHEAKPQPPPKDDGYTPRVSTDQSSGNLTPDLLTKGLRISTTGALDFPEMYSTHETGKSEDEEPALVTSPTSANAPPQPAYAPPPPPPSSSSASKLPHDVPEMLSMPASHSERGSSELSPQFRKTVMAQSGSSRPSTDSQRAPTLLPGSTSMSSFADSTRQTSMDTTASDSQSKVVKAPSPSPQNKKLTKFWHIIKELLDTEHTYHQDVKIVVDIYKPTAIVPDLLSAEDKKTLFGNLEDIEKFVLWFYDELRKAVTSWYTPGKSTRWLNKRGSYSTTQSDSTVPPEVLDAEKARGTTVGQTFLNSLQRMEKVYREYLKNHDAANQRLSALRGLPTIKAWLDECHANAADITSAWDLDSLLVKPTQRIGKYPLLLEQLLDVMPEDHADRPAIFEAKTELVGMLVRINSEKKRADLINDLVNGKRKDTDVKSGLARAFGRRTERIKEKVGVVEEFKDPDYDGLAHKMSGHYIRLQIVMRDFQDNVAKIDNWMVLMNSFASGLDQYTDVQPSQLPELESKWRKYGQAVREITSVIFPSHRAAMQKRVIDPLIECLKLHGRPRAMIAKRKKRIIDYARCKSIEKRGEKPDKKTIEASETYLALNDQLKLELPRLYDLTGHLSRSVLRCFVQIQAQWFDTWQRRLRPLLDETDLPQLIEEIEPSFMADYELIVKKCDALGLCNGAVLADSANFLSPQTTLVADSEPSSSRRTMDSYKRTMSSGSDSLPAPGSAAYRRRSSGYNGAEMLPLAVDARMRSNSSLSNKGMPPPQAPASTMPVSRPWSNNTPNTSFSASRPVTGNPPTSQPQMSQAPSDYMPRSSVDQGPSLVPRGSRPGSSTAYTPARHEQRGMYRENTSDSGRSSRLSGIFNSALPGEGPSAPSETPSSSDGGQSAPRVILVCASLFEFSIDRTRREAGYPYLTYVQGEVFDVVAQKGELWLAKNQDDASNTLGWIWEQHFVVLSQD